jgi:hypothetical protein
VLGGADWPHKHITELRFHRGNVARGMGNGAVAYPPTQAEFDKAWDCLDDDAIPGRDEDPPRPNFLLACGHVGPVELVAGGAVVLEMCVDEEWTTCTQRSEPAGTG